MAARNNSKRELLDRWKDIEEEESLPTNPVKQRQIQKLKEKWFPDAFKFLTCLPEETHIWCGCWDLMESLLETFHDYYNDNSVDSPLKLLWRRISRELRQCTQCICQHHHAQEVYNMEFESEAVSPLLRVLRTLDEERVTVLLKEINVQITGSKYKAENNKAEVVSVMFEVLMFPSLLDDQSLVNEFQTFIEAIDNSHELTLAGHQQYPGVYALLFLKSEKVRSIGLRLAGHMGKLRNASDLEPVQPLLKKCIGVLETEVLSSTVDTSRPRVQLERITVWLGVKALLGFLEPPAFEEGILERYPIFLSIVLNYVSDDTPEFTHAVTCLRLLFEILGCKLWLRTTFSPGVMRNTLLGQCFHTRSEKSHKEIFDLFQPFLQSLEALQDGEHERQRRHFLYFLLHQVPRSSNFSFLMRKKARKIAILIIDRGYKMNPPCPPFECAHMWGPSLMCSLKDSSLHNSLRQPAFDLVQTIIVSDAAALISLKFKFLASRCSDVTTSACLIDDEDELHFSQDVEEIECNCWTEFSVQSKLASRDCREWMCVPMLWFEVLVEMGPSSLPVSFSKAVIWALSRFSVTEPGDSMNKELSAGDWSSYPVEIASCFGWEVPNGSDDGGDGRESKNSANASTLFIPLIRTFKRCAAYFVVQMNQSELWKQWTWEPRMAESLILLIVDPNDDVRQFDRVVLEHVSNSRGLASGLQFLCSSTASLSAVLLGLGYALKLVLVDSIANFHNLHHLLFVVRKLVDDVAGFRKNTPSKSSNDASGSKFLFEGGFLRQAIPRSSPVTMFGSSSNAVDIKSWDKFCYLLSRITWPSILKFLAEGKVFLDSKNYQMACVRLLEIVPVVFGKFKLCELKLSDGPEAMVPGFLDFTWLHDLIDWGKSSLVIIKKHWKESLLSLVSLFKSLDYPPHVIKSMETLISCEPIKINELKEQVSRISVSLSMDATDVFRREDLKTDPLPFESLPLGRKLKDPNEIKVIVLSDDESEKVASPEVMVLSSSQSSLPVISCSDVQWKEPQPITRKLSKISPETDWPTDFTADAGISSGNRDSNAMENIRPPLESSSLTGGKPTNLMDLEGSKGEIHIEELVLEPKGDPLEVPLSSAGRLQPLTTKLGVAPKRQLIQLEMPMEHKAGYINTKFGGVRRFKPPRLDDWYRPILEIDFFAIVGLSSANKDEFVTETTLKEVPRTFFSAVHYMEIFRPLVLEEFKAQLNSSYMETSSLEEMSCGSLSIMSVERIDDFHIIRCIPNDNDSAASRGCSENDLVLLTKHPLQNAAQEVHMVGKVDRRDKDNKRRSTVLVIRFYLQNCSLRLNKARKLLIERSKWYISRIMSITPQLREFQALSSLNDIPILPIILNPLGAPHYAEPRKVELGKLSQPLQRKLRSSFNESQLQAISVALEASGAGKAFELSLIQGPPGTGKTKTIVAIVSALLALGPMPKTDVSRALGRSLLKPNSTTVHSSKVHVSQSDATARAWQDALLAKQLVKEGENGFVGHTESSMRGRILICAQSNAAVDELVTRLSNEGLYGSDGKTYKPYLVRVGNPKTIHPNSLPFFIGTLVDQHLAEAKMNDSDSKNDTNPNSLTALRSKLEKLMDNIQFYESQRANLRDGNPAKESSSEDGTSKNGDGQEISEAALGVKLNSLYAQKKAIYSDLATSQAREKRSFEENRFLRHEIRKSILKEAEVVVTTLSGCGSDIYAACTESITSSRHGKSSENSLFDAVLIDEAAQALEPATLIPLQLLKSYGTKCIMVGDPKQLPATVLSNIASKFLYECSMFERLQKTGYPVTMLAEQYRMHPEICLFPSVHFYEKKLLNGRQMDSKSAPFHENMFLRPYVFFDVVDGHEHRGRSSNAQSLSNESEADAAVEVLRFLKMRYSSEFHPGRIGIITPYKSQVSLLRSRFTKEFGPEVTIDMEFNTVDGFQGREVDILILSTVRASEPRDKTPGTNAGSIGFVADVRRMNVALTRAKFSLWIVGNKRTLRTNPHWDALLWDAEERKVVVRLARPYESIFRKSYKRNNSSINLDFPPKEREKETCGRKEKLGHSGMAKHPNRTTSGRLEKKSPTRDFPPIACQPDSRSLKDVVLSTTEKSTGINAGATDGANISKGSSPSEYCMVGDSSQRESTGPTCPIVGSNHEREINTGSQVPSGGNAPKSLIEARKRQRDAVDALLPSALIPSKKLESSSKAAPIKRPPSPSASRGAIKPPKQFKGRNLLPNQSQAESSHRTQTPKPPDAGEHPASGTDLNQEWEYFKKLVQHPKGN